MFSIATALLISFNGSDQIKGAQGQLFCLNKKLLSAGRLLATISPISSLHRLLLHRSYRRQSAGDDITAGTSWGLRRSFVGGWRLNPGVIDATISSWKLAREFESH